MEDKFKIFMIVLRDVLFQLAAATEDYLGIAYDESGLSSRRRKSHGR